SASWTEKAPKDLTCAICDNEPGTLQSTKFDTPFCRAWLGAFSELVRSQPFLNSRKPRVAAMQALRRLVLHSDDPEFLNLETSVPGQWCIQSLNSSVREIRIAAGRTL